MSELRDKIRANVLGAKPKEKLIPDFYGSAVVIRQPALGVVLSMRKTEEESQIARMLIDYTFVPDTSEKVFEEADAEALLGVPFGPEMKEFMDAINEILGLEIKSVEDGVKDATKSA